MLQDSPLRLINPDLWIIEALNRREPNDHTLVNWTIIEKPGFLFQKM
jgi:hypothetical protein